MIRKSCFNNFDTYKLNSATRDSSSSHRSLISDNLDLRKSTSAKSESSEILDSMQELILFDFADVFSSADGFEFRSTE